jgi:hypothetical protein
MCLRRLTLLICTKDQVVSLKRRSEDSAEALWAVDDALVKLLDSFAD